MASGGGNGIMGPDDWLDDDHLMLLECWSRDGYTYQDIAKLMGISTSTLSKWKVKYPEIGEAIKTGREIVDYKVENALLKSALGYKTKETTVITVLRNGKMVEETMQTVTKEQAPNVSAIQCWLYNRLPKKWRNMNSRANILDGLDEDTSIEIKVSRADGPRGTQNPNDEEDKEWQDEINNSVSIRGMTEEEKKEEKKRQKATRAEQKQGGTKKKETKVESEPGDDLDYWPEDWEDEDE